MPSIPVVDLSLRTGTAADHDRFVDDVGAALRTTGFFAVKNHDVPAALIDDAYAVARAFFARPAADKARLEDAKRKAQRGFTSFGKEHAKGSKQADLKEFFQIGRTDVPDTHPVHAPYGPNVWPDDPKFQATMTKLYEALDVLGRDLLVAAAEHLGDDPRWYADAVDGGDTILRVIHYPPVGKDAPPDSVRAGAHEDINFITLLVGATEDGLELLQNDGSWLPIKAAHGEIVVDAGDMLQSATNGFYKSTTHRVVRPKSEKRGEPRFSMPLFVHPRADVDLTPRPIAVARTGGKAKYPTTTAGAYLRQRLREIGVG